MGEDLSKKKKEELQTMAEDMDLQFTPENTKAELAAMIEAAREADATCSDPNDPPPDEPEAEPEPATTEQEQDDLQKRLQKAQAARLPIKGIMVAEWLSRVAPPDWYFSNGRGQQVAKATSIVLLDEDGVERLHSYYRLPDCAETRALFAENKNVKIISADEFTEDIKIRLAMADEEARRAALKHRRLMRAEGMKVT